MLSWTRSIKQTQKLLDSTDPTLDPDPRPPAHTDNAPTAPRALLAQPSPCAKEDVAAAAPAASPDSTPDRTGFSITDFAIAKVGLAGLFQRPLKAELEARACSP